MSESSKQITAAGGKATVYVDVDDEITNVIDKVKASDKKIVALVLPKRAAVLQSVVNMKLLKKAAVGAKKNVVLITSETALLPLAGAAGVFVAKSLQSKPAIPPSPTQPNDNDMIESGDDSEPVLDKTAAIGSLAAAAANKSEDDTIHLDNAADTVAAKATKTSKLKHLKVPNFERFRLGFFLAGLGLLLLIGGWFLAFAVLPKATITVKTDTTSVVSSFDFTASTNVTELDVTAQKIPASLKELKKSEAEKVPATGEKDLGTKASGDVTLSIACADVTSFPATVPAGTTVSSSGLNFITQEGASLSAAGGPGCRFTDTVEVTAGQNGEQYNLESGKTFTVASNSKISGSNGDSFEGGTSKKVKVVSQKDIDEAVNKIKERVDVSAGDELKAQLETDGLFALKETLKTGEPKLTPTPAVDAEATEVNVVMEVTYSMLGIQRDDLLQVIRRDIEKEVDLSKQSLTDDGIDTAVMRINTQATSNEAFISFRSSVTAGPELDIDAIKEAIRGKKRGEAEKYIGDIPDVEEVVVEYSPFWVYSTPKAAKKITINVEKPADTPAAESEQ